MNIAVIDTGCANIFSVEAALSRLGVSFGLAQKPDEADSSARLILPGVGAAGPAMARLEMSGWADALRQETRPVLGICLGMQLLFERSAEGEVSALGVIPGDVKEMRAPANGVLPHMGWNTLSLSSGDEALTAGIADGSHVYFVHGFAAPVSEVTRALTEYGAPFSAVVRRANFMGCQFHPERSGATGRQILRNFSEL